jgi:ankyrin repeat protein
MSDLSNFSNTMLNISIACEKDDLDLLVKLLESDDYNNFRKVNRFCFPTYSFGLLCEKENLKILDHLFKNGYVGTKTEIDSCLHIACKNNKVDLVQLVLSKEMVGKIYVDSDFLKLYLISAVKSEQKEIVGLICEHLLENKVLYQENLTKLVHDAAISGNKEIVLYLMKLNSNNKKEFKSRYEAAIIGACDSGNVSLLNDLLKEEEYISKVDLSTIDDNMFQIACNNACGFFKNTEEYHIKVLEYIIFSYQIKITDTMDKFMNWTNALTAKQMLSKRDLEKKISDLVGKSDDEKTKNKI